MKKTSYVFGLISMILGIVSLCYFYMSTKLFGIAAIILGIISLSRKEAKKGFGIAGIVTGALGVILGVAFSLIIFSYAIGGQGKEPSNPTERNDPFCNNTYCVDDDNSVIYFGDDGTFIWYRYDDDHSDYYMQGTYQFYEKEQAVKYVTEDISAYGITKQELNDYFERNHEDEVLNLEHFYCLTMNYDIYMEGDWSDFDQERLYYGFYADDAYGAVNMKTANHVVFEKVVDEE